MEGDGVTGFFVGFFEGLFVGADVAGFRVGLSVMLIASYLRIYERYDNIMEGQHDHNAIIYLLDASFENPWAIQNTCCPCSRKLDA